MRTDAIIDKRQVLCPNASSLGHDKCKAQVGDLIATKDGLVARMIGRIAYAPALSSDNGSIRDYILAIGITGMLLDHVHERWINPADVVRVQSIRDQRQVIASFLADDMTTAPIDELRRCYSEGWTSLENYRKWFRESRQSVA